jgi:hypothetical protein
MTDNGYQPSDFWRLGNSGPLDYHVINPKSIVPGEITLIGYLHSIIWTFAKEIKRAILDAQFENSQRKKIGLEDRIDLSRRTISSPSFNPHEVKGFITQLRRIIYGKYYFISLSDDRRDRMNRASMYSE